MPINNPFLQGLRELAQHLGGKLDTLTAISSNKKLDINLGESTKQLEEASKELTQVAKLLSKKESTDHVGLTKAVISALGAVDASIKRIKLDIPKDTETPKLLKALIEAVKRNETIVEAPEFTALEKKLDALREAIERKDNTKLETKVDKLTDVMGRLADAWKAVKLPDTIKLDDMQFRELAVRSTTLGGVTNSGEYYTNIQDNSRTVTTAGTRVQLSTTAIRCSKVEITAKINNVDFVVVGGSTVVAAEATRRGTPLAQGDTLTLYVNDLSKIYLDAVTSGDGVTYVYYD